MQATTWLPNFANRFSSRVWHVLEVIATHFMDSENPIKSPSASQGQTGVQFLVSKM